jgi:hypothetical protein
VAIRILTLIKAFAIEAVGAYCSSESSIWESRKGRTSAVREDRRGLV